MSVVDEVLSLLSRGYLPYTGHIEGSAYAALGCTKRNPRWFFQDQKFVCVGCSRRCSLVSPVGFELVLPVGLQAKRLAFADLPAVSARELLEKKMFLTFPEVEYILNLSKRQVYNLLDEGRLERHPDPPTRITADSVRREAARRKVG